MNYFYTILSENTGVKSGAICISALGRNGVSVVQIMDVTKFSMVWFRIVVNIDLLLPGLFVSGNYFCLVCFAGRLSNASDFSFNIQCQTIKSMPGGLKSR